MIKTEIINGVYALVEYIRYSNGKVVKRVLDKKTQLPVEVITVSK